ncbi:MAG: hypothetical protein Q9223_003649, partial [Gallowayella weberi]
MAKSIKVNGSHDVDTVLTSLVDNSGRLDRARRRFSQSPPFRKSPSPGSTLSHTSNPPTPGAIRRDQELQESSRREYSNPDEQLTAQAAAERRWILEAFDARRIDIPTRVDFDRLGERIIKKRWREQGIWNDRWEKQWARYEWRWKHQEPLQDGSENEVQSEPSPHNVFDDLYSQSTSESDVHDLTLPLTAEQQIQRERDREASRPIHQFLWQISRERDLIYGEPVLNDAARSAPLDINTKAYESERDLDQERDMGPRVGNHAWDD